MFRTTFAQNYSQNAGNAISKTQKNFKSRGGNRMPPGQDPQRNARLQAKINFPISGKRGFFYFWLTPWLFKRLWAKKTQCFV
jgi:hypothetical protein